LTNFKSNNCTSKQIGIEFDKSVTGNKTKGY